MSDNILAAVNDYFDHLVKSRFIEMFEHTNQSVRLEELSTRITKGTTPTTAGFEYTEEGVNFVKIENITEDGAFLSNSMMHISDECHCSLKRSQLMTGDILFSIAGAIGRVAVVPETILPANTNQALAIIRLKENVINATFLMYVLRSKVVIDQYSKYKRGAAQLNLSLQNVSDFMIPLPSRDKQDEFADFVKQVDKSKLIFQQLVSQYDELIKSRFNELIHLNPHLYELGDLISIYSTQRCDNDVYPILSITKEDGVVLQNEKFKKRIASIDVSSYKIVPRGKLIQGIHIDERNFAIQDLVDYGVVSPAYKVYSIKEELVEPVVLEYYLRSNEANAYIRNKFRGSIKRRESITKEDLFKMPILLPELSVQSEIVKFVVQVDKSKSNLLCYINMLNNGD